MTIHYYSLSDQQEAFLKVYRLCRITEGDTVFKRAENIQGKSGLAVNLNVVDGAMKAGGPVEPMSDAEIAGLVERVKVELPDPALSGLTCDELKAIYQAESIRLARFSGTPRPIFTTAEAMRGAVLGGYVYESGFRYDSYLTENHPDDYQPDGGQVKLIEKYLVDHFRPGGSVLSSESLWQFFGWLTKTPVSHGAVILGAAMSGLLPDHTARPDIARKSISFHIDPLSSHAKWWAAISKINRQRQARAVVDGLAFRSGRIQVLQPVYQSLAWAGFVVKWPSGYNPAPAGQSSFLPILWPMEPGW